MDNLGIYNKRFLVLQHFSSSCDYFWKIKIKINKIKYKREKKNCVKILKEWKTRK